MVTKRTTPEDDYDRLAERVWQRGRGKIKNKADFIAVYDTYMKESNIPRDRGVREKVFGRIQRQHKVSPAIQITKKRLGVFVKAGEKPSPAEFNILGTSKGRRVYVRRTIIKYKGSSKTVYRDKKGRFAKVQ